MTEVNDCRGIGVRSREEWGQGGLRVTGPGSPRGHVSQ